MAVVSMRGNMVASWGLGSTADDHTTGHTLTNVGTVTFAATGKQGNCATFGGSPQALTLADHADFRIDGNQAISGTLWWKPSSFSTAGGLLSKRLGTATATIDWEVLNNAGSLLLRIVNSGGTLHSYSLGTATSNGTWYHIYWEFDGSNLRGRVNHGSVATPVAFVGSTVNSGSIFQIGRTGTAGSAYAVGDIDEVRIWKRVLTDDEQYWSYADGNGRAYGDTNTYPIKASQGSYTQTGQILLPKCQRLITTAQGSYTLTGRSMNPVAGRKVTMAQGSYAYTGQSMTPRAGRRNVLARGTYALNGQIVRLLKGYKLTAAYGAYALTGQAMSPKAGRVIGVVCGAYAATGQAMAPKCQRKVVPAYATYALTGQNVGIYKGYLLTCAYGGCTATGQAVGLRATRTLAMAQGSYGYTGQAAGVLAGRTLALSQGGYDLTGFDVDPRVYRIIVASGTYGVTGADLGLALKMAGLAHGSYTSTGQAATIKAGRKITPSQGSYTLEGQNVQIGDFTRSTEDLILAELLDQLQEIDWEAFGDCRNLAADQIVLRYVDHENHPDEEARDENLPGLIVSPPSRLQIAGDENCSDDILYGILVQGIDRDFNRMEDTRVQSWMRWQEQIRRRFSGRVYEIPHVLESTVRVQDWLDRKPYKVYKNAVFAVVVGVLAREPRDPYGETPQG